LDRRLRFRAPQKRLEAVLDLAIDRAEQNCASGKRMLQLGHDGTQSGALVAIGAPRGHPTARSPGVINRLSQ